MQMLSPQNPWILCVPNSQFDDPDLKTTHDKKLNSGSCSFWPEITQIINLKKWSL